MGERPREGEPGSDESGLVDLTEEMADRAIRALKEGTQLPDVMAEADRARALFGAIQSRVLLGVLLVYLATAGIGVAIALLAGLPDWYMHAAMYVVIFSFLVLYLKAHLQARRFLRGFFAVSTALLQLFFAYVLTDLAPARVTFEGGGVASRDPMPALTWLAVALAAVALGLLVHWIFLARYRLAS